MGWQDRTVKMLGEEAVKVLGNARVAVFGLGGVGGNCVEALARAGVGHLTLIDADTVDETNLNRQLIALTSTVGEDKVEAAKKRLLDINPDCKITARKLFFLPENAAEFDFSRFDYLADAVDTVSAKLALIEAAKRAGIPVISCMGTGNKLDATAFRVADIAKTKVCPLARVMRAELKKRGISGVKTVYSEEEPVGGQGRTPGSVSFVPPVAGFILAGEIIKDLAEK